MPSKDDYTAIAIGIGALVLLSKWGLPKIPIPNIPNPLPPIIDTGKAVAKTADEVTGGLQKDSDETKWEYFFEYDVPFSDRRIPLIPPGLRREKGSIYTTEGQYTRMDIAEPDQPWGEYFFEIDLPGVPAYDLRDVPADLYRSTIGRVLR
tara:strand:- start:847 stop:1296 length:450 start_codon:yes stop_codon:yes gene_type:complete